MQAQQEANSLSARPTVLGVSADYGFLIKHTASLREIDDAYPYGISVDWGKLLLTQKAWEFCSCFPKVGASLSFWSWDNPDILGHGLLALGYAEPYFNTQKRWNYFFRMGLGGAYLTNPYDEVSNPLNESYSTHLSFVLLAGAGVQYRLTDQWSLRLSANYNHTSNGGVSTPNKGLNFPTLSLGVSKSIVPVVFPDLDRLGKRRPPERTTRWSLLHFSGWSNATVGDKDKFYVSGIAATYSRWIGGRSALTGGTELILDFSRKRQLELEDSNNSFVQGGALLGHEFWLGRVTFSQQLGVYYFNEYRVNDDVYQRYALTYHLHKNFFAGFSLKAHRHVADFFDIRIGYTF